MPQEFCNAHALRFSLSYDPGLTASARPGGQWGEKPLPRIEELENRVVLSVGGGWISSTQFGQSGQGMLGQYYNNSSLSGTPSFTRWDNRVDFTWSQDNAYVSGSPDPNLGSVGPNNWSAQWTGIVQANFSETYTFVVNSAGNGVRLWVTPITQQQGSPIINEWTSHGQTTETATIKLQAGQDYAVELQLSETTATVQQVQLQWSSPSTPIEDIEPAVATGLNVDPGEGLCANLVNGTSDLAWYVLSNWNATVPCDSSYWPEGDGRIVLGSNDNSLTLGGTYLVQFNGMASVNVESMACDWIVNGTDLHSGTLQAGEGYNAATNTTTAEVVIPASSTQGFVFDFSNTCRDPSQLSIGNISYAGGTVTVSLPSVTGFEVNQHILISGVTGTAASSNGIFTITGVNATNNTVSYSDTGSKLSSNDSNTGLTGGTAVDLPSNGITEPVRDAANDSGWQHPPAGRNPLHSFSPRADRQLFRLAVHGMSWTNGNNIIDWSQRNTPVPTISGKRTEGIPGRSW